MTFHSQSILKFAAIGTTILGIVGWTFMSVIDRLPSTWLDHVELPNSFGSVRVVAADGRVYIASTPFGRVQRYGPDGFERGFQVDSRGGVFDISVPDSGVVLVCSARARALISYDRNGVENNARSTCAYAGKGSDSQGRVQANVPGIASSWISALAVPLWHPFVAWLMLFGGALAWRHLSARGGNNMQNTD